VNEHSRHPANLSDAPIGVILAGGMGRRIGGSKAVVELCGRPLIDYPLAALQAVLRDVAVIAKPQTELPRLSGVAVWTEADPASHPLVGLVEALGLAAGRPVLACAVDLPFVTAELVAALADTRGQAPAVVASHAGQIQPLLGCYQPQVRAPLATGAAENASTTAVVGAIGPRLYEVSDPDLLFNVNRPEDLLRATAMLERGYPNVKS